MQALHCTTHVDSCSHLATRHTKLQVCNYDYDYLQNWLKLLREWETHRLQATMF